MSEPFVSFFGIKFSNAIAAVFGSVLSIIIERKATVAIGILTIFGGVVSGVYFSPVVVSYFGMSSEESIVATHCFVAIFGLKVVCGLFKIVTFFSESPFEAILKIKSVLSGR